MKESHSSNGACRRVREYLDAYLDGALPGELQAEVERHLAECADCSDQMKLRVTLRSRVQAAVRKAEPPEGFEARLRTAIQARQKESHSRFRSWMRIAAGIVFVTLAATGGWQVKVRLEQQRMIDDLSAQAGNVFGLGLGDHLHCAKFREAKHPWVQELVEMTLVEPLGPEYEGVRRVVAEQLPEGFEIWMAHRCENRGRRFIHVALRGDEKLLSVILTRKEQGEFFGGDAVGAGTEPLLHRAAAGEFQMAGFESAGYLVFVISDLSDDGNLQFAMSLGGPLSRFLKTVPA